MDPKVPDEEEVERAVEFFKREEVIAYPTETIYGLGADVCSRKALKKVYELKARDYGLPISILVSDPVMLKEFVTRIPERAQVLMRRFWPGPLTILFEVNDKIPRGLVTNTGKVGVRFSSHPIASALVSQFGRAITTTSANLSGFPASLNVRHVEKYFGDKIPCIIDGGDCEPSRGSTVVDVTEESMRIIRDGSIPAAEVIECFQRFF